MILENPALVLNIGMKDVLEVLESTLKERNWNKFELANIKLAYVPYYIFNYDTLVEQKMENQTYSQGFSGAMAMNAVSGKLEPLLTQVMNEQPVDYEREITHDLQYEMQSPAISMAEVKDTCNIKLAGQFNVGKDSMAVSGFRLVYWPVWKIFVTLPSKKVQRIEVEAVSGYPMNIEEVPEREKTRMEITSETLQKFKTPEGWAELSKTALRTTGEVISSGAKQAEGQSSGSLSWLLHSKTGKYILLGTIIIILILLFFN